MQMYPIFTLPTLNIADVLQFPCKAVHVKKRRKKNEYNFYMVFSLITSWHTGYVDFYDYLHSFI
jgi:hypothetical protein